MSWLVGGLRTTVGSKYLMGVTGLVLFLFTLGHMLGNLQVFAGPERLNAYAKSLQDLGPVLWVVRLVLLATLIVHVASAVRLTKLNRAARPTAYSAWKPIQSTDASRTMMMTGLVLLAFIVYHLLHFTFGLTHPGHFDLRDSSGRHDVHAMVILGFQQPTLAVGYVVAMTFLALHLSHGVQSTFQSLGWNGRGWRRPVARVARALVALVVIGNFAMPLAILLRLYTREGIGS